MKLLELKLQEVGLTNSESKVYLTLLKIGETQSGSIIKTSGLQSSVVHNALNSLTEKGFITFLQKGKIKQYKSLDPKIIKDFLEEKKNNFSEVLPKLRELQNTTPSSISVEVYEGWKGLLNASLELIKEGKQKDVYKYFAVSDEYFNDKLWDFFLKIDKIKKRLKIKSLGISNIESKPLLKSYSESKIKFVRQEIPPGLSIFKDKIIIFSLSDKPTAILIQSEEIAKQYHTLWDDIWENN